MCDCALEWVQNRAVDGSHNLKKVRCSEYVDALEHELILVSADNAAPEKVRKRLIDSLTAPKPAYNPGGPVPSPGEKG